MSETDFTVATAMAAVNRTLGEAASREDMLEGITQVAQQTIPGVDFASISVRYADGRLETLAPTTR